MSLPLPSDNSDKKSLSIQEAFSTLIVKLKLICIQVFWDLLGQAIEYDKVLKLSSGAQARPPSHLQSGDVKATIAVLGFIISSAAKHSIDNESLSSELQQLGL
ncbi:COMM domain-containing protein 4-like, partial [Ammospiza caudacuta]|uniref:COMM domain-containing protein 4-like n=1 Tax=Ammospiza caudacuta TaxID=2857398 RepID=UPI0027397702